LETPLSAGAFLFCHAGNQAMKSKYEVLTDAYEYRAPVIYVGIFYGALVAWTIISIFLLGLKQWTNWFQLFMIVFIFVVTWYFSMGISYRINVEEDGTLRLTSFRRILRIDSRKMGLIEGPRLPIGFIRFRLEREKAYLFCVINNKELQKILLAIRKANPDIRFKNLRVIDPNSPGF
jgi:hypothetical protein